MNPTITQRIGNKLSTPSTKPVMASRKPRSFVTRACDGGREILEEA